MEYSYEFSHDSLGEFAFFPKDWFSNFISSAYIFFQCNCTTLFCFAVFTILAPRQLYLEILHHTILRIVFNEITLDIFCRPRFDSLNLLFRDFS